MIYRERTIIKTKAQSKVFSFLEDYRTDVLEVPRIVKILRRQDTFI